MTPEELKEKWRRLDADNARKGSDGGGRHPERPFYHDPVVDRVTSGRVTSARDRLMRRYRMMFLVAAPFGIFANIPMADTLPWWGMAVIVSFFLTAAGMDFYLYRGIKGIDLSADGVEEVASKARFYRRRHHMFQLLLIPYAAVILAVYFSYFGAAEMRWALATGGAVGFGIGLGIYIQMMRDYRRML